METQTILQCAGCSKGPFAHACLNFTTHDQQNSCRKSERRGQNFDNQGTGQKSQRVNTTLKMDGLPFQDTRQSLRVRNTSVFSESQNPCSTAVHITFLHLSLQKTTPTACGCGCDGGFHALQLRRGCRCRGHGQCCGCLVCFVAVMYPLSCVHCYVFQCECLALDHINFVVFSSIDLIGSQDEYFFNYAIFSNKYAEFSDEGSAGPKKTSVGYRKISNPPQHPVNILVHRGANVLALCPESCGAAGWDLPYQVGKSQKVHAHPSPASLQFALSLAPSFPALFPLGRYVLHEEIANAPKLEPSPEGLLLSANVKPKIIDAFRVQEVTSIDLMVALDSTEEGFMKTCKQAFGIDTEAGDFAHKREWAQLNMVWKHQRSCGRH